AEIRIGDAPIDEFNYVNITFSEVKLHSNETGWESIPLETMTIDLLNLHLQDLNETLAIGDILTGNYTKLWIVVENATGILKETGETIVFKVPSNTLKIQHLFSLQKGNNTITIDIDLNNSIRSPGHGKKYILLPVIGAFRVKYWNGNIERIGEKNLLKNMTENRAPAIDLVANGSQGKPITIFVNESIEFNASGTFDIEGDALSFLWDFDDGTNASGVIVIHTFTETGSYWVMLTVSDGDLEASEQIHVTVKKHETDGGNGQGNDPH
ncbi:MAG: DUF4382 domain-containing protein, partial [Candidatus Thermoplasmatota archaeon]|nr:DUF4382 domain-containing protein [Candidatus Thermoplasmatota archaeon]MBU1941249.1 DUF4382 domain-containing protein [Candidatus Thermoplasmatota archaeon]